MRPAYRKVAGLQSVINACILVLASTATRKIQEDIYMTHGFETDTTKLVVILPDRYAGLLPNSFLLFNLTTIKCYDNSKLKISLPLQAYRPLFIEHEEFSRKNGKVGLDGRTHRGKSESKKNVGICQIN